MAIVQGYDGSRHAPSSEVASKVKREGHKKEEVFAQRLGDINYVVKGQQKPDVIKGENRYSIKGADKNIQLLLSRLNKSEKIYGTDCPMYQYQLAASKHRHFKKDNNDMVDTELFNDFYNSGLKLVEWLRDKNNLRMVLEKVFSDNYDANKLVVLRKVTDDALVYDMKEVIDLYVNSEYDVRITEKAKITIRVDDNELFYLEVRGGTPGTRAPHCGSMNHGVRKKLYDFLKENLTPEVIPA
jgi:hypothetical protein